MSTELTQQVADIRGITHPISRRLVATMRGEAINLARADAVDVVRSVVLVALLDFYVDAALRAGEPAAVAQDHLLASMRDIIADQRLRSERDNKNWNHSPYGAFNDR